MVRSSVRICVFKYDIIIEKKIKSYSHYSIFYFIARVDHSKAFVCTTCGWGFFCFGAIYLQGLN